MLCTPPICIEKASPLGCFFSFLREVTKSDCPWFRLWQSIVLRLVAALQVVQESPAFVTSAKGGRKGERGRACDIVYSVYKKALSLPRGSRRVCFWWVHR